jgi:YbbR domain-containing protein
LTTKIVPLKTNIELNFKPQFHLKEKVIITPNKIKITGPATILDTITQLLIESKTFNNLDDSFKTTLKIIHPENTTVNTETVSLKIPIERFTEKELKIKIKVKNKPENIKIKLFPSELKLTILVGLSAFENIEASKFEVFVDYNTIEKDTKNLKVIINPKIENIKIIRYSPENVEYLFETK